MERRQVKGFACFNINGKTGPLVSYWLFFQLPCFISITKHKCACNTLPTNTATKALYVVSRVPTYIIPLANCTVVGFIYLFLFKHWIFSFCKNKWFEYPSYKHFSAFSLSAECFSSGELELLTLKEKWTKAMNGRS